MSAAPPAPPPGIQPIFLRGVTCEKFGLKTGEGVTDMVPYKLLSMETVTKEAPFGLFYLSFYASYDCAISETMREYFTSQGELVFERST
jgi:hypothetical protein